jgi:starch phosphorylase
MANKPLAALITETIGAGWEADLDRLRELEPHVEKADFRAAFAAAKRANKVELSNWIGREMGVKVSPDAMFDVQIKRIHEYKRQLLNILETIAHWQKLRADPKGAWVPRVKVFGGKAAPGYAVAKEIIRLINDVAEVVNNDPVTGDLLKIVYPPNYNVSMAERVIPASDLSEQISTAGKEASGTGNMKFMMNGAPTIGTLDGANVEILKEVGDENFFLFGLTAEEVAKRREDPDHSKKSIEASQPLQDVLQMIAEGRFSPEEPGRYHQLVHGVWHHDYFLVADDFAAYHAAQGEVDRVYADPDRWWRMAALNTARSGFFSSDRTIRSYMDEIWQATSAL